MLKSVKYRTDAKMIFGFGLLICAIACAVYGILTLPEVKGIPFDWKYIIMIACAAGVFALIALIFLCKSNAWAKKEETFEVMEENTDAAVCCETCPARIVNKDPIIIELPESIACSNQPSEPEKKIEIKVDMKKLKKVGMVAIPAAAVAVTAVAAAVASNNAKKARKDKRRQDVIDWLIK